ncbi:MAG: glycosyltransferase family 2 protein [Cyanobacteria bacterium P01_B01_bin.77]
MDTEAISFSIVITTYNRIELLKRAIATALNQTIPCQVIVVDNASTDGTQTYVESLGDQVLYHRNATNAHHSGAVNVGVERATGTWIKLVDDDDYLAPTCIAEMINAIQQRPEAVICSCQAAQVDDQGQELSRTHPTGPGRIFYIPQADIHYGMFLEVVPFGTPIQVAVRRDAFLKAGGWDLNMTGFDDIDSWIRIADYGDALFINKCLTYRTVWPGGYDQKITLQRRLDTNILIKERIYQHVSAKHQDKLPTLETIRQYLSLHWMIVALKQKQLASALNFGLPAIFFPKAWQLLRQAINFRQQKAPASVAKLVLE